MLAGPTPTLTKHVQNFTLEHNAQRPTCTHCSSNESNPNLHNGEVYNYLQVLCTGTRCQLGQEQANWTKSGHSTT